MNNRRRDIPCPIVLYCSLAMCAGAQENAGREAVDGLHADATYSDVYVNDSFEAADAIARASVLVRRGRWGEASEMLQRASEEAGDKLVRVSPGHYVGIRNRVNALISAWPEEGIAAYRELYEHRVESALSAPTTRRTTDDLLPLFNRYFCTSSAAGLADPIGQLAIEAGNLALAEHVYSRVLEDHPDRRVHADHCRTMLAIIAAMRGGAAADAELNEEARIRWMGQDRRVHDVVADVRGSFTPLHGAGAASEWPTFGGDDSRNRAALTDVREFGLLWRFDQLGGPGGDGGDEAEDHTVGGRGDRARYLSINPVVAGGLVFLQHGREVIALHRNTGAAAWRFRADGEGTVDYGLVEEQPPGWDSVTVFDGRLFASLPGDAVPYYAYETARSPPELICLNAGTGRVLWRIDQDAIEETFAEVTFDSAPLVRHGCLYVVGRRRRSFGFEDCYLYRFDAATGEFEHRTHLGSASTGTFGVRQATRTIITGHRDIVYVCTNLGTIAAVCAETGNVRWLALYKREQSGGDSGFTRSGRDARSWQFNPVIRAGKRVIALPTDADRVMVLGADEGRLIQSISVDALGGIETILGVQGDLLCGAGVNVACFDLTANTLRWSAPLPDEAVLYGRGVWVGDRLLVPSRQWLSTFRVSDGARSDTVWDSGGEGGNVVALPDQVLVAGPGSVSAYVKKSRIWGALRERMAAAPSDPLPALELAEIALSNNEYSEAVEVLDEAVRRVEQLGEPVERALERRLFDDVLLFSERLAAGSKLDAHRLDRMFLHAAQYAPDAQAHLSYRFRFAGLFETYDQPGRAVRLYQQILRDRSLRAEPVDHSPKGSESGGAFAQARIAELIARHGRAVYAPHEDEAKRWLEQGRAGGDETVLRRIVSTFPNSRAAPLALVAHGDLLARRAEPRKAARLYARALHRYPKDVEHPPLLRKIADAHEQAGRADYAYLWLTKAAREHPSALTEHQGRKVTFMQYRERLTRVRDQVEPSRPNVVLPLDNEFASAFDGTVELLVPRFGDEPLSCWSRYFVRTPSGIHAFETPAGTERWANPAPVKGKVDLLIATPSTGVFATQHEVFSLDVATGARSWSHGLYPEQLDDVHGDWEDSDAFQAHSLHGRHLLSVRGSGEMTLIAIDTGDLIWTRTHRPRPAGRVTHSDAWVAYPVAQDDRVVICLINARTGMWSDAIVTDERRTVEDVFLTLDGRLILVTSRSISCFDPESGTRKWRVVPGGHIRLASLLLDLDALYFSDDDRYLDKISLEDGRTVWESQRIARRGAEALTVWQVDGSVIVSTTSSVVAIDAVTGLTLWKGMMPQDPRLVASLATRSYVLSISVLGGVLDANGVAYFHDHRNASGIIPLAGGTCELGSLPDVRAVLAADGVLLVQTGNTVKTWSHR